MGSEALEWFCPHCRRFVPYEHVTLKERHDEYTGGCGCPVVRQIGTSRIGAKSSGLMYYFTGKPCHHGNVAVRTVSNGCLCLDCTRDKAARWARKYRRAREAGTTYAQTHREENVARARAWQRAHPERVAINRRRWMDNNPAGVREALSRRQAAERQARPTWYSEWDKFVFQQAADLMRRREDLTGFAWARDHIIPLRGRLACGLHCAANIQVIPKVLNSSKGTRLMLTQPGEWIWFV